jgi:hypothetical protein
MVLNKKIQKKFFMKQNKNLTFRQPRTLNALYIITRQYT